MNAHSSHSTASTTVTDAEEQDPEAIDDMEVDTAEALQVIKEQRYLQNAQHGAVWNSSFLRVAQGPRMLFG